jgi:cellulose synthase operon protein C
LMEEAKNIAPDYAWVYIQESDILEKQDRYEEANTVVDYALQLRPNYHAALLRKETALIHLNRDDEAIELLERANEAAEHGIYGLRLQYRYSERDDFEKTLWALSEYERFSPLMTNNDREWLAARRGDCYYVAGELSKALECYNKLENGFYKTIHDNLKSKLEGNFNRKKLDVPFIRQHQMTCAPATLASLSKFFGKERDHLEIAEAICYDGTPWHKERTWAEENGFEVYEFRFTEQITKLLIDRNLPFTLSTNAVTSAHLQACIGYDDRLGLALIRDPTNRHYGEMLFEQLAKQHPVYGPRGMLLIPNDQIDLVAGLEFPDKLIYDGRHQLMLAIDAHDEFKMLEAISTLRAVGEEHPLVKDSEIRLERYRNNGLKVHQLCESLFQNFPENEGLEYDYFNSSLSQCGRNEQLEIALKAVGKERVDPVFYAELGDLYLEDLRELDIAEFYFKKAAKYTFSNARSMASLALCAYRKNDLNEAIDYQRFASCQSPSWEGYAYQYFQFATEVGREDEAVVFLEERTKDQGRFKSASWITLSRAFAEMNDDIRAREIALKAIDIFPEDGELLVYLAMSSYAWGNGNQASEYIERAKAYLSEVAWHEASGRLARNTGDRTKALRHFKRLTTLNVMHLNGQRSYCDLLEEEYGQRYVLDYLRELLSKHGQSLSLLQLYAEKLSDYTDDAIKDVLQKILEIEPNNLWAMREYALVNEKLGDLEQAISMAKLCVEKQPYNHNSHGVLGGIYARNGKISEAIEEFRKSILLDANYSYAISEWLGILESKDEKIDVLNFYQEQLEVQVVQGGSIREYRELAYRYLEPDELLVKVKKLRHKRAGEWAAWSAEKDQLLDMGLMDEAVLLMDEAVMKFPYIPRIYVEQATVYKAIGDNLRNISCLEKALELSPSWDWVARLIADAYELEGNLKEAEKVLREAIRWSPLNPANTGCLCDLLCRLGEKDEAFDTLAETLKKSPMYEWGWREISRWAVEMKREDGVISLLEFHHDSRGGLKSWWSVCFDVYDILDKQEMALDFCDACLSKDNKNKEMHDSRAYLLARMGRIDQALAATNPAVFGDEIPPILTARKALIIYNYVNPKKGIEVMEKLAESHPDYLPAFANLSRWYFELRDTSATEQYTKQWLRLDPHSHMALGYLGAINENKKNLKEAARYYEKAFQLNPQYTYAGYRAFELSLDSKQLDKIPRIIQLTSHFGRHTESLEMKVRYEHARGDKRKAFDYFSEMIRQEDVLIEEIGKTIDLFPKHGANLLIEFVEKGEAKNASLLQAWLWGRSNVLKSAAKIVSLTYSRELKYPLWKDFLEWVVSLDEADGLVKTIKKNYYVHFCNDTYATATFLRACTAFQQFEIGCEVTRDLLKLSSIEDWMLTNAAYCQIAEQGLLSAEPLIDRGLELRKENGADYLLGMKSIIEASRGNIELAEELLAAREEESDSGVRHIGHLAMMMIYCMKGDSHNQKLYWYQFKQVNPQWEEKKYYLEIMKYCTTCAKQNGRKWLGKKKGFFGLKLNWNTFWYFLAAYFIIRLIAR